MISARTIDQLLLSFCETRWRKVGGSFQTLEGCGIRPSGTIVKIIDMRMAALVGSGRLEAQGNIRKWRYSEVRLPVGQSNGQDRIPISLLSKRLPTEPHEESEGEGYVCYCRCSPLGAENDM
jgi:hypothetical protein